MSVIAAAFFAVLSLQDPDAPVCKEGALTTIEINECALLDLIREEARMNAYLAKARELAAETDRDSVEWGPQTRQVEYLAEAQAAWERYAEITCEAVYDTYAGGTIRTVMALGCKIEMTRERTHRIWSDHLTFMDDTPPVLPEPTEQAGAEYDAKAD